MAILNADLGAGRDDNAREAAAYGAILVLGVLGVQGGRPKVWISSLRCSYWRTTCYSRPVMNQAECLQRTSWMRAFRHNLPALRKR